MSEVERKMLYFSETAWTLPDILEVNNAFDREYDQTEYEQKIGGLVHNLCARTRANDREESEAWNEAVRTLRREDHYLLVLIDAGEPSSVSAGRLLRLVVIAVVIAGLVLAVLALVMNR